jgi:hypothetical protein
MVTNVLCIRLATLIGVTDHKVGWLLRCKVMFENFLSTVYDIKSTHRSLFVCIGYYGTVSVLQNQSQ